MQADAFDTSGPDLLLIGGGLANGLLALRLSQTCPELDVRIVEAADSLGGVHTWSFFENDLTAAQNAWIAPLVCHRWSGYEVRFPQFVRSLSTGYCSVTAERFAAVVGAALPGRITLGAPVLSVSPTEAILADGRKVAVKVLRPGVERRVADGLDSMRLAARLVWRLVPLARRLEPAAFVETIARSLDLELDMRLEAAAASEMAEVMAKDGYMSAPAVIWDGVGRRVLTLEWAQGTPMTDPALADLPGLDVDLLADNVVRAFLVQALDHGAFHADLHEGNLFASAPAHLTAIDFGIVGRLGPAERRYLAEILWGFISRDYDRIARVHFEAGYVPPHHSVETFAQALRAVGEPVIGRAASQVSMGRLLGQLFEITALFDMRLRPELILLQKTMVSVEGVARRLQPDHDLWKAAQPVVERWIRRELGPQAQARDALNEILAAARALSRLVQEPPRPTTVVMEKPGTPAWLTACVTVAVVAALAALGLSLWPLVS